jgi:pimeloyl-ACP methyl ester carboxylesterase
MGCVRMGLPTGARRRGAGSVLVVALSVLPVLAARPATAAPGRGAAAIGWQACADLPRLQCATLAVPLDWARPGGDRIGIALVRRPADDPAHRVGSLLVNPGGPGGSGVQIVKAQEVLPDLFPAALARRFDLIGFDPRGVGESTPVHCGLPVFDPAVSQFPTDEAGFRRLVAHNRALGASCRAATGPLLSHVDTTSAARDIEAIRAALGEGGLNFLGLSYGSMLGTAYAELFGNRIRAMALDGALDHSQTEPAMLATEARTAEDEFNRFARWCRQEPTCPLAGQDVAAVYDRLVAAANRIPIPAAAAGRTVNGQEIQANTQGMLLFKDPSAFAPGWAGLAAAIVKARAGDASDFLTPPDTGAALAIECQDFPAGSRSFADLAARERLARSLAPHLGGSVQTWSIVAGCIGWPEPAANPPHRAQVRHAPPTLLVNATHDPSTGYLWALRLHAQLPGNRLLTRLGDGHTSALTSPCARAAIEAYLIDRALPRPGATCTS